MIPVECAGNRRETDIGCAAVTRFADNVRILALPLALADHGFIRGGDARSKAASAANLRVRPRHVVRCAQVRTVRDIHAAGRSDQDGIVTRGLARHSILNGRSAAGTRAVTGNERFGRRQFRVIKARALIRVIENRQYLPLNFYGRHINSSQWRGICSPSLL